MNASAKTWARRPDVIAKLIAKDGKMKSPYLVSLKYAHMLMQKACAHGERVGILFPDIATNFPLVSGVTARRRPGIGMPQA